MGTQVIFDLRFNPPVAAFVTRDPLARQRFPLAVMCVVEGICPCGGKLVPGEDGWGHCAACDALWRAEHNPEPAFDLHIEGWWAEEGG